MITIDESERKAFVIGRICWLCAVTVLLWTGMTFTEEKRPPTADRHKERGMKCESCHGVAEPKTDATGASCLPCHKSMEAMAERTKNYDRNPHENHISNANDLECTQCHKGHKEDEILCHKCHTGMTFEKVE